eukprot:CFRG0077T1
MEDDGDTPVSGSESPTHPDTNIQEEVVEQTQTINEESESVAVDRNVDRENESPTKKNSFGAADLFDDDDDSDDDEPLQLNMDDAEDGNGSENETKENMSANDEENKDNHVADLFPEDNDSDEDIPIRHERSGNASPRGEDTRAVPSREEGESVGDMFSGSESEDVVIPRKEHALKKKKRKNESSETYDGNQKNKRNKKDSREQEGRGSDEAPDQTHEKPLSYFEQIMQEEKAKKKKVQIDEAAVDELVAKLVDEMAIAAQKDRECVINGALALHKLKALDLVLEELNIKSATGKNSDGIPRQQNYIENGVLIAMKAWLDPLPDKSLPHNKIRRGLLQVLTNMQLDQHRENLKESGIGRAIMMLYRHPKETAENKKTCLALINKWSRQVHGLSTDYRNMSSEDRREIQIRERNMLEERMRKAAASGIKTKILRKQSTGPSEEVRFADLDSAMSGHDGKRLTSKDPGWRRHAAVPKVVQRDYLISPSNNLIAQMEQSSKKGSDRTTQLLRKQKEKKKVTGSMHHMSVEGRGLH